MRFTYKKPEPRHTAIPRTTLQIFSLKVSKIREGLQWPLQVFGMVAIRDCVDHNRNIIFDRPRDNCQILTREVCAISYLSFIWLLLLALLPDEANHTFSPFFLSALSVVCYHSGALRLLAFVTMTSLCLWFLCTESSIFNPFNCVREQLW
jgi:hypothetical protein